MIFYRVWWTLPAYGWLATYLLQKQIPKVFMEQDSLVPLSTQRLVHATKSLLLLRTSYVGKNVRYAYQQIEPFKPSSSAYIDSDSFRRKIPHSRQIRQASAGISDLDQKSTSQIWVVQYSKLYIITTFQIYLRYKFTVGKCSLKMHVNLHQSVESVMVLPSILWNPLLTVASILDMNVSKSVGHGLHFIVVGKAKNGIKQQSVWLAMRCSNALV